MESCLWFWTEEKGEMSVKVQGKLPVPEFYLNFIWHLTFLFLSESKATLLQVVFFSTLFEISPFFIMAKKKTKKKFDVAI